MEAPCLSSHRGEEWDAGSPSTRGRRLAVVGASVVVLVCGVVALSNGGGHAPVALEIKTGLSWPAPGSSGGELSSAAAAAPAVSMAAAAPAGDRKAQARSKLAVLSARVEQAKEAHASVRVQAALAYDRDMETSEQSEQMRTRLKAMERTAAPAMRAELAQARAVLTGGSEHALKEARDMLMAASRAQTQDLAEAPSPPPLVRSCMPDCGVIKNVFSGVDPTKYPYDERHGGHTWKKIQLAPSGLDKQYTASEHADGPEDQQQRRGGYVWKDLGAKPERNVWDHISGESNGPVYHWHDRKDDSRGYYVNVIAGQGLPSELFVPANTSAAVSPVHPLLHAVRVVHTQRTVAAAQAAVQGARAAVVAALQRPKVTADAVDKAWTNKALASAGVNLDGSVFAAKHGAKLATAVSSIGGSVFAAKHGAKLATAVSSVGGSVFAAKHGAKLATAVSTTALGLHKTRMVQAKGATALVEKPSAEVEAEAMVDAFEEQQTVSRDDDAPPQPVLVETVSKEGNSL